MHKMWVVARNDLQLRLQDKQNWLLLLALPVLIIYLTGLGAQKVAQLIPTTVRIDVLDGDGSAVSEALIAAMAEANDSLLICPADNDPADGCGLAGASLSPTLARERLADQMTFGLLTIPEGFAEALDRGDDALLVFETAGTSAAAEIAFQALQDAVARVGGPIAAARLAVQMAESQGIEIGPEFYNARRDDAEAAWARALPVQIVSGSQQSGKAWSMGVQVMENGFKLSTPSIAVMFVMVSILAAAQSLAEERMMGILERVGTMPVSKAQWLGGKLLATCLLGWSQFAILLLFGALLGVSFGHAPLAVILVVGSYVLAITAMALVLATWARTPRQASSLATLAYMVLAPLGGAWWPLIFVPGWMRALGHLSPIAWCLDGLNALIFYQGTWADVVEPVGVLLLFAGVCFIFGVWRFRYQRSAGGTVIIESSCV